ncbi:hypothetical protein SAMN05518683_10433 [Salibacterium halotolerans]|uniref:Uncharacterized protein n=2 Tax=Salibacterium halotolerans TaxID=1884432 RepID=A0A1I5P9H2_9BACI|nr:hypothetical protein SAMN05518683_10433 [Salibacterium halotolerans]
MQKLKKTAVSLSTLGLVAAVTLSGESLVSAQENSNQGIEAQEQDSEELHAGAFKKITAAEALEDKDVKAAMNQVYDLFPETESYEINAYENVVSEENYDKYVIRLKDDGENFFHFAVDAKTGDVSYTIQSLEASEVRSYPNAEKGIDEIHAAHPELKSYEITGVNVVDNFIKDFSRYNITFSDNGSNQSMTFGIDAKTGEIIHSPENNE